MCSGDVRTLIAGFRFQAIETRHSPGDLQIVATTPLFALVFLSIVLAAGRDDLVGHALLAPALMALIGQAILLGGEVIDRERWSGTLEAVVAAPANLATLTLGRVLFITTMSIVCFVEVWLVARLAFGLTIGVAHPVWFAAGLLAVAFATAGTATIFAALFVLARSARIFQNTISYPLFVLGGVLVPVDALPAALAWPARGVYLSWGADLLRDALDPSPMTDPALRLVMVVVLGLAAYAVGRYLLGRILDRVRTTGTLTYA